MSSSQLTQGLLLHLQTNRNFVEQKIYKEFAKQCLAQKDITTLNKKKMVTVIKFLFDFGSNQQMKPFFDKLQRNIDEFIKQEIIKKPKNQKGNIPMDMENLYQLVVFCVNNAFQKQVKKEIPQSPKPIQKPEKPRQFKIPQTKKKPQLKKQQEPPKQEKKKPQITILNPQLQAKVDKIKLVVKQVQAPKAEARISCRLQIQKIPPKSQFKIQKYQMPKLNVGPKYLQTKVKSLPKVQKQDDRIIYEPIDLTYLKNENNKKIMRQRFQKIFQHYCSQQQNKGCSPTFDKIKSELQHMTLGKLILFCKNTEIFKKSKLISRQYLTSKYKKIAGSKTQIDFNEFESIIKQIDTVYLEQMKSLMPQISPFPTYQARLMLHSNQGYVKNKKNLDMRFFSRDQKNQGVKAISTDFNKKDLTAHSGKIGKDLQQTLDVGSHSKKSQQNTKDSPQNSINKKIKSRPLNLSQINMKEWPKIDWLQQEVKKQEHRLIQDSLPKIARRKDVVGNIKKRLQQVSKLQLSH